MKSGTDKRAVALRYDRKMPAPIITALGRGHVAGAIERAAIENSIPVVKNAALTDTLYSVGYGVEIPESCYVLVAALYRFVYATRKTMREETA